MTRIEVALAVLLVTIALAAPSAAQGSRSVPQERAQDQRVELGSKPTHRFRAPLWNGCGASSLESFRGRPVLVEFWSLSSSTCVTSSVAQTLRLKEQFGDELVVIMVECSGESEDSNDVAAFALRNRWLGGGVLWTREVPFVLTGTSVPRFALLNAEGELILRGDSTRLYSRLQETIEREVEVGNRGPKDLPGTVARLWRDMARGSYAKAFDAALVLVEEKGQDPEIIAAAHWLLKTGRDRLKADLARARWMVDHGYVLEAETVVDRLAKAVRGREAAYLPQLTEVVQLLASEAMQPEFTAARALRKLESRLYKDGPGERIARSLERFAERHADTRCAERALQLARLAAEPE